LGSNTLHSFSNRKFVAPLGRNHGGGSTVIARDIEKQQDMTKDIYLTHM